jgi:catechol 2,3-dioxygenase-like lactoylglutathione lyase family enzyme
MKTLISTLCLFVTLALPAAAKERSEPFKATTGAFFALSVQNLAESVQWYSDKLGLTVTLEAHNGNVDVTAVEGGGLLVELIHDPAATPAGVPRPELLHGVFKAGFLVKDFEKTVAELRTRGVDIAFGPFPAHDKQRANVIIRDNVGNLIQIFGD